MPRSARDLVTMIVLLIFSAVTPLVDAAEPSSQGVVPGQYIIKLPNSFSPILTQQALRIEPQSMRLLAQQYAQQLRSLVPSGLTVLNACRHASRDFLLANVTSSARPLLEHLGAQLVPNSIIKPSAEQGWAYWNLPRLNNREPNPSDSSFSYPDEAGSNVDVYVLDTGVYLHSDFSGRARFGYSPYSGVQQTDVDGHGTHVAGTVASNSFGVAKRANIIAVKVFDDQGNGNTWSVGTSILWTIQNRNASRVSIINMSLGGGATSWLDDRVTEAVNSNIYVVVAAGNERADACSVSPARAQSAITVGALDANDYLAGFSNYGSCVDIFAPGVSIASTWIPPHWGVYLDGTSMASPHVAGVLAALASQYPQIFKDVQKGTQYLFDLATKGKIKGDLLGTVNQMLFMDDKNVVENYFTTTVLSSSSSSTVSSTSSMSSTITSEPSSTETASSTEIISSSSTLSISTATSTQTTTSESKSQNPPQSTSSSLSSLTSSMSQSSTTRSSPSSSKTSSSTSVSSTRSSTTSRSTPFSSTRTSSSSTSSRRVSTSSSRSSTRSSTQTSRTSTQTTRISTTSRRTTSTSTRSSSSSKRSSSTTRSSSATSSTFRKTSTSAAKGAATTTRSSTTRPSSTRSSTTRSSTTRSSTTRSSTTRSSTTRSSTTLLAAKMLPSAESESISVPPSSKSNSVPPSSSTPLMITLGCLASLCAVLGLAWFMKSKKKRNQAVRMPLAQDYESSI